MQPSRPASSSRLEKLTSCYTTRFAYTGILPFSFTSPPIPHRCQLWPLLVNRCRSAVSQHQERTENYTVGYKIAHGSRYASPQDSGAMRDSRTPTHPHELPGVLETVD